MLILTTVKDYCKRFKITDAAVRKNDKITKVLVNDLTYVVIEDSTIETLQSKNKLLNQKIKTLNAEVLSFTKQDDLISEQKERIKKLEERIELLETKLDKQIESKEILYEKVIGHMTLIENKKQEL